MRLTTYINAVDPVAQAYDGFFVHARGRSGSPLDASGPMRDPAAPPEPFRDDLRVPVLCFQAETDLIALGYYPARQPDSDMFRLWEVAGTSHADVYTFVAGFVDSGALPIAELAAAVGAHHVADGLRARTAAQHRPAALRAPGRARALRPVAARRNAAADLAPARGATGRPGHRVRRRRARHRARRHPHAARRRADRDAVRPRQQRRADLDVVRHDDPVQRGEARVALLQQGRLLRQVRRRHRRRRRRRLLPRSRRPRDQSHRRRALPRLSSLARRRPRRSRSLRGTLRRDPPPRSFLRADAGSPVVSGRKTWLCRGRRRGSC